MEKIGYGWQRRRRSYDIYLGCEIVDVEADPRDVLGGLLRLGIPPLLDEPPGLRLGFLDHGHLGLVPDADHVEELLGVALLVLVEHLLVVRVEARLLGHELLELPEGGMGVDVDLVGDAGELDLDADGGDGSAAGPRVGVRGALLDEHPAGRRLPPRNGRNIGYH
jgi:hypothetical protein